MSRTRFPALFTQPRGCRCISIAGAQDHLQLSWKRRLVPPGRNGDWFNPSFRTSHEFAHMTVLGTAGAHRARARAMREGLFVSCVRCSTKLESIGRSCWRDIPQTAFMFVNMPENFQLRSVV